MKKYLLFLVVLTTVSCNLNKNTNQEELQSKLDSLIDKWHHSATIADEDFFFSLLGSDAVYLGTDPKERWLKSEFISWSIKYFERDTAWAFYPYNRIWEFSDNYKYAWFDELLKTHMGVCRGSGVMALKNDKWEIRHYNLALTLPNEQMNNFRELQGIRKY